MQFDKSPKLSIGGLFERGMTKGFFLGMALGCVRHSSSFGGGHFVSVCVRMAYYLSSSIYGMCINRNMKFVSSLRFLP